MILIENFVKRILVKEVLKTIPYFFLSNYLQCQVDKTLIENFVFNERIF